MKGVNVYTPLGQAAPVARFIDGLDPRLRDKLIRQLIELPNTPRASLREPHFKHFTLERYRDLYELRARGKVLVRIIFTILPNGEILLLHAFIKRQSRDTMQALEQALSIMAQVRDRPELAAEYIAREETAALPYAVPPGKVPGYPSTQF